MSAARICVWENNCHMGAASTSSKSGSKATKSASKKPAVKKAAPKKAAPKITAMKKPAAKKAAPKIATSKKPEVKKPALKTPAAKKITVQEQLTLVETRLKRANTATRKNVKALDLLVSNLQADSKKTQSAHKAAFTRKINALNKKLSGMMEQSQSQISKDLSHAVSSGDIETIKAALSSAEERLTLAEITQADALGKVNRHLANLATAIEARLDTERSDRNAAITATEAKFEKRVDQETAQLTQKIDGIETDTSAALDVLGEKIESFAEELDQRQSRIDTHMGTKMSEIALETQTEFEAFRSDIDQRINDLSSRTPANEGSNPDQGKLSEQVNFLQGRLNSLEQHLASLQNQTALNPHAPQVNTQNPLYSQTHQNTQLAPPLPTSTNIVPPQTQAVDTPAPAQSNVVPINDAFTPAATDLNPYSAAAEAAAPAEPEAPAKASHIPVEFDPSTYQPATHTLQPQGTMPALGAPQALDTRLDSNPILAPYNTPTLEPGAINSETINSEAGNQPTAYAPLIAQPVTTPPPVPAAELPPLGANGQFQGHQDLAPQNPDTSSSDTNITDDPYIEPALPYADPAYAENELRAERIGDVSDKKVKLSGSSKGLLSKLPIKGQSLKYLLLGSAIAILTIFAGKTILGGQKYAPISEQVASHSPEGDSVGGSTTDTNIVKDGLDWQKTGSETQLISTEAPIGQYTQKAGLNLSQTDAATLDGAAAQGNPIAQYQLGMSKIEAGDIDAGVTLLRSSAAQNLIVAQYRLAKLYEIGKGVTRDEAQARQLIEGAAKSGHRVAMHDLGLYYAEGRGGVDVDMQIASGWFEQAAMHGVVDSQYNLAVLAESAQGEAKDLDTAYFWYNIAANQGDQFAQKRIRIIADGMSAEQISAAKARIDAFKPRPVNSEINGVFRNVPWNSSVQSVEIDQIRQAQTYLAELGYEVGKPDGAIGPNTRAAIKAFEKANDLPQTGTVSDTLLDRLELSVGA